MHEPMNVKITRSVSLDRTADSRNMINEEVTYKLIQLWSRNPNYKSALGTDGTIRVEIKSFLEFTTMTQARVQ